MTFEDLTLLGTEAGNVLKARGQSLAVVDGATGGLISAALLAMPGASAFYRGGGVIDTIKGRRIVLGHEPGSLRGLTSATEAYALAQARLIRARYETVRAWPKPARRGQGSIRSACASGTSAAAVVGPGFEAAMIVETGHDNRLANMIAFTRNALEFARAGLSS